MIRPYFTNNNLYITEHISFTNGAVKLEVKSKDASGYNVYRYDNITKRWECVKNVVNGQNYIDTSGEKIIYGDYCNTVILYKIGYSVDKLINYIKRRKKMSVNVGFLKSLGLLSALAFPISGIQMRGVQATQDVVNFQTMDRTSLKAPLIKKVSANGDKITLSWGEIQGATGYNIYRYNSINGKWEYVKGTTGLSTSILETKKGKIFYYKVRAFTKSDGRVVYSSFSDTKTGILLNANKIEKVTANGSGLYLQWNAVKGANAYAIYRYDEISQKWIYQKGTTGLNTTDRNVQVGKEYNYKIMPFRTLQGNTFYGSYSGQVTGLLLAKGSVNDVQATGNSINLSWNKAIGASGYNVYNYSKDAKAWQYLKSITDGRTYTEGKLKSGTEYLYKVRPYKKLKDGMVIYGEYSDIIYTKTVDTNTYVNKEAPAEVLNLLNAERRKLGLSELVMDDKLSEASIIRAKEAKNQVGDFSDWAHKRPNGDSWFTVLGEVSCRYMYAGENAAYGYDNGASLYQGWYNSPGHRDNMLNPNFGRIGIAMVKSGDGRWVSYMLLTN